MSTLTGTWSLVRLALRRDRIRLPVWVLAILALVHASASAVQDLYATQADLDAYAAVLGASPAAVALSGPAVAVDTIGGVTIFETSISALVLVALMAVFNVVRHTRAEEESGRTELVRATVVGRHAPVAAALVVVSGASLLVGAGAAGSLLSQGLSASGSVVFGASVAALGLVMAAVTACAAQVTEHSRAATGIAGAVLAAAFLVRAVGDVSGSGLSWASPIGWSQAVHPFGGDRWLPLLLSVSVAAGLTVLAMRLVDRRDVGAGFVTPRPGPAHAGARLSGPVGLAARLQRGALAGWAFGVGVGGLALGSFTREIRNMVADNPELAEVMGAAGAAEAENAFLALTTLIIALLAGGFAVQSALRLRSEETAGRVESLLATALSRGRWALGSLLVTLAGTTAVTVAGGIGVGLAVAVTTDDGSQVLRLLAVTLTYLPAVLVLAALCVLLIGWLPRATALAWAVLGLCFVIGWLGNLLDFPRVVELASPFSHVPAAPTEAVEAAPLVWLTAVAVGLVAVGLAGLRRRDLAA
ncbi:MAG TPA: ABC transporter permease [Actinomycetales bacterium]|nr:ABC transporter permease [Actinomycetales bacterium]